MTCPVEASMRRFRRALEKRVLASALACAFGCSYTQGQELPAKDAKPSHAALWRGFQAPEIPPLRPEKTARLQRLLRAGNLYLTAQDAIALVLENSVDVEVARYEPLIASWQLERAKAGGAVPAARNASSQVGSVASGQGVRGSEAAAGVIAVGAGIAATDASNAAIAQIGPVVESLDPVLQESDVFTRNTIPQIDTALSLTPVLTSTTRVYDTTVKQGFLIGGSFAASYDMHYLNENALSDTLNPSVAPNLSVSWQQNLLRGFGPKVNSRGITVAKLNRTASDLVFKTQIIAAVVQTLTLYYGLSSAYEDLKARQSSVELAQTLFEDNERLLRIGAMAPLDVTSAAAQLAVAQRDLITAQAVLQQQELQLKNLMSRGGVADPLLRPATIIPVEPIAIPETDGLPPMQAMIEQALESRSDLAVGRLKEAAADVNAIGSRNALLPSLRVSAGEGDAGLAGRPRTVVIDGVPLSTDPRFLGGVGTAVGQIFRRDYRTDRAGAVLQTPLRNRLAQGDYAVDQMSIRQIQLGNQKDRNQVQVDLMKSVLALQQARAIYKTVQKNQALARELLDSEQKKLRIGDSTPYLVNQAQRDVVAAEASSLAAQVDWIRARILLDQTLGTTLEANHVSLVEALDGTIQR